MIPVNTVARLTYIHLHPLSRTILHSQCWSLLTLFEMLFSSRVVIVVLFLLTGITEALAHHDDLVPRGASFSRFKGDSTPGDGVSITLSLINIQTNKRKDPRS